MQQQTMSLKKEQQSRIKESLLLYFVKTHRKDTEKWNFMKWAQDH